MSSSLNDPRIARGMQAQLRSLRTRRDAGERQIGWKVGFGAPAAKQRANIDAPLVGFLLQCAMLPSGASVSLKGWQKPVAEAEIAVHMNKNLPADSSHETVKAAIVALGPAIEDDVEGILAGNIFQRHVIIGPRDETRAGLRLDGITARVNHSGKDIPVPADLETNIGSIVEIVRHVADVTAALGEGLRAGQFIICGSLTAPLMLESDEHSPTLSTRLAHSRCIFRFRPQLPAAKGHENPARPPRGCPRCCTAEDEDQGVCQIARREKARRDAVRSSQDPPWL
jgi:2-keto-4-pentenoate hydratase